MTTNDLNKKIAKWLGWRDCRGSKNKPYKWKVPCGDNVFEYRTLPDFQHSDSEAIKLLPVLVEKRLPWKLYHADYGYHFEITHGWDDKKGYLCHDHIIKPTISEAICAAVEMVIDKEEGK